MSFMEKAGNFLSNLGDAVDVNVAAGFSTDGNPGGLVNQQLQTMAQQREKRKQAEALGKFGLEWLGRVKKGEISEENYGEKLVEYFQKPEFAEASIEGMNALAQSPFVVQREMERVQRRRKEKLSKNFTGGYWSDQSPEMQGAIRYSQGLGEDWNPDQGTLPGWKRQVRPETGKEELYYPTQSEREQEAALQKERTLKSEGLGRYEPKEPFNEEEYRRKQEIRERTGLDFFKRRKEVEASLPKEEKQSNLAFRVVEHEETGEPWLAAIDPKTGDRVKYIQKVPKGVNVLDWLESQAPGPQGEASVQKPSAGGSPGEVKKPENLPEGVTGVVTKVIGGKTFVKGSDGKWYEQ